VEPRQALAQIVGRYAFVFRGREGYDDVLADGASPETVFDDRTVVPYGATHLGPTVFMGVFVGYLIADVWCAPTLEIMGWPYVVHHLAATCCWTFCACNRVSRCPNRRRENGTCWMPASRIRCG